MMTQDPRALFEKAQKLKKAADGTWKIFWLFDFLGSRREKYEDAASLYVKSANAFRVQDQGNEAGLAFENAAAIQKNNLEEQYEAANNLVEASKSYRKHDPVNALRVLQQAIDYYTENGNFRRAATYVQEMAEIYDFDIGDKRKAADLYEKAAGWFDAENAKQISKKLRQRAADIFALNEDYRKAIGIFENAALLKDDANHYFVNDFLQKAGICALAVGGEAEIKTKLNQYTTGVEYKKFGFNTSREYRLLADLAEAVTQVDPESFQLIVDRYNDLGRLGEWKETLLQRAKARLQRTEDEGFA